MALLKLLYVVLVSLIAFWFKSFEVVGGLLILQLILLAIKSPSAKDFKGIWRMRWFLILTIISHSIFHPEADFTLFQLFDFSFDVGVEGLKLGVLMASNLLVMLLATSWLLKSSSREDLVKSLSQVGLSTSVATSVSYILDEVGSKSGGGKGDGSGGGKSGTTKPKLKNIIRGDMSFLDKWLRKNTSSEIGQLGQISLAVTLIRFVKIAPGLPIAPGHKNVLILPFFAKASSEVDTKFAATKVGLISGIVHFFAGFGKYGPLGPIQFMVPGFVVDLLIGKGSKPPMWYLGLVGGLAGLSRVFAEVVLALLMQVPDQFFLLISPYIISQFLFGVASAPVSKYLLRKANN